MRKFTVYLKEAEEVQVDTNLKDELTDMIKKSLNTSDSKTVENFIDAYKKDSEKNQIEGLINNADIYDFYLKYDEDIDEILTKNNFYDKSPKELNVFSLYDYIIAGTKEAVNLLINSFDNVPEKQAPNQF
jgi:hypothetical protein